MAPTLGARRRRDRPSPQLAHAAAATPGDDEAARRTGGPGAAPGVRLSARCSAGLAVQGVLAVARAELLHLQAVGVVPTVLLGDVVALLAVHARQGDLGADVCALASHGATCSRN